MNVRPIQSHRFPGSDSQIRKKKALVLFNEKVPAGMKFLIRFYNPLFHLIHLPDSLVSFVNETFCQRFKITNTKNQKIQANRGLFTGSPAISAATTAIVNEKIPINFSTENP